MEIEGGEKPREPIEETERIQSSKSEFGESGRGIEEIKRIQSSKSAERKSETQSVTETIRADLYSYLNLITKNVMKLKADSKLRASCYSSNEIQIHLDDMRREVTNLLQMMENVQNMEIPSKEPAVEKMGVMGIQVRTDDKGESAKESRDLGFHAESILKALEQIHTMLAEMEKPSYKDVVLKDTPDSLTNVEVHTEIEARETDEAPERFLERAKGRDEVSPRIWTSGLEIEEAKEMGGEAKGRDEVLPMISLKQKMELMREEAKRHIVQTEEESFDQYRRGWVSNWSASHGTFTETSE